MRRTRTGNLRRWIAGRSGPSRASAALFADRFASQGHVGEQRRRAERLALQGMHASAMPGSPRGDQIDRSRQGAGKIEARWRSRAHKVKPHNITMTWVPMSAAKPAKKPAKKAAAKPAAKSAAKPAAKPAAAKKTAKPKA